jgi:MFS family permease
VLPRFAQDLGARPQVIGLIAASTITGVVGTLPAGALSDLLGRRRMMLVGCLFFAGPPFLYPLVDSPGSLLARSASSTGPPPQSSRRSPRRWWPTSRSARERGGSAGSPRAAISAPRWGRGAGGASVLRRRLRHHRRRHGAGGPGFLATVRDPRAG